MMKGIEFRKIYIHTYNVESFAKKFKINNNNNKKHFHRFRRKYFVAFIKLVFVISLVTFGFRFFHKCF